jgi:hypothetical protein
MNIMQHPTTTMHRRALGALVVVSLGLVACGGSDDAEPAPAAATQPALQAEEGPAGVDEAQDGTVRDELTDEMGSLGDVVDDAIASLPAETTWGIVADQLGDNVELEIVGADIRLTFDSGTTDDALFDCTVANSFVEEGQSVTMVYPDGEVTCGQ